MCSDICFSKLFGCVVLKLDSLWLGCKCPITLALVFWCVGGPEELRLSAWMALQEWRTTTAAENGLRDRRGSYPHAQTQLPAQVNPTNYTFSSLYISKMQIHYFPVPFLSDLTLLNRYANISQACLVQLIASVWMHVCVFVQPFLVHAGCPLFFFQKRPWRCERQRCTFILSLPVFWRKAELSRVSCHAERVCTLPHAQNMLKGVRLHSSPGLWGVGCPPPLGYDDSAVWA